MKSRTLGILMLIPSLLFSLGSLAFIIFLFASINTYITWYSPSIFFGIALLIISVFSIKLSMRFIRNRPFRYNKPLGIILIVSGISYFLWKTAVIAISNITGFNPGGWLQPIIASIVCIFFVLLGMGFMIQDK